MKIKKLVAAFILVTISVASLSAYENLNTHPQMTIRAKNLLKNTPAEYIELDAFSADMRSGSINEDIPATNVVHHFFDPATGRGLTIESDPLGVGFAPDALERGQALWDQSVTRYGDGNKAAAYELLGRVLHLMAQDMGQPGHVHNDPHLPVLDSDRSPLEVFAEDQALNHTVDFPNGTTIVPGTQPQDLGLALARFTYQSSRFAGELNRSAGSGHVDVGSKRLDATFIPDDPFGTNCPNEPHWQIISTTLDVLCFDSNTMYDGTTFTNDWWQVFDRLGPDDPLLASSVFYFDQYDKVEIGLGGGIQNLNLYYYQLFVPQTINYSAGLMKLFAQTVDPVKPAVELRQNDAQGTVIPPSGASGGTIFVRAKDPGGSDLGGDPQHPTPSGIYKMELKRVETGAVIAPVPAIPAGGENPIERTFSNLEEGQYELTVFDGLGNDSVTSFKIDRTQPELMLASGEGQLSDGVVTYENNITVRAVDNPINTASGMGSIAVYQAVNDQFQLWFWSDKSEFTTQFPTHSWYFVNACDKAGNCTPTSFGVFSPNEQPPARPPLPSNPTIPSGIPPGLRPAPNPNPAPYPDMPPNTPPQYPRPIPRPGQPPECLPPFVVALNPATGLQECLAKQEKEKPAKFCERTPQNCRIPIAFPHDPNAKYGPTGSVTPGQAMTYTIEFENEGAGAALGTFVTDALDPTLDGTALTLRDMRRVDFRTNAETPADFPWFYDGRTRTITVQTGDADSRQGGRFVVETRLKPETPLGSLITNQAVVHFPNALEITPTNVVVSAVFLPTELAYVGSSSATFLASTRFSARLTNAGKPLVQQTIEFALAGATWTALTDTTGLATISTSVAVLPGNYSFQARYAGDGFLYSPQQTAVDFRVDKKPVRLQAPFAAARSTETASLPITLTDDEGQPLNIQGGGPRTIHLELLQAGGLITPLASAVLVGTSTLFEFPLPQPLQLSWSLRARFDGDSFYTTTTSTGVLRLIDQAPPVILIRSPAADQTYSGSQLIQVGISAQDSEDPTPAISAVLFSINSGQSLTVSDGNAIEASSLTPGPWTLLVAAVDWAGNRSTATVSFQVLPDALPPRTTLVVGEPHFGTSPLFVSSQTSIGFSAVDDRTTVGDSAGLGVARTDYSIGSDPFTTFSSQFIFFNDAVKNLRFFSVDLAGNTEATQTASLSVDVSPPITSLIIATPSFRTVEGTMLVSTRTLFSITAGDPVISEVASGVSQTEYRVGFDSWTVFTAPFALTPPDGSKTIDFFSRDNVLNTEVIKSNTVLLDATAPQAALLSPHAAGSGICSVVKGLFPVLGTAQDAHLRDYQLEVAPSSAAASGFTLISSGTIAVNAGSLGIWNTGSLSGWQTLRLTVVDLVENVSVQAINVFVGDPGELLTLGNHEIFDMPKGVAVSSSGTIYVADRNNDRIAVFSSTGTFLASLGSRDHDENHHGKPSTGTLRLNKPSGVAVDEVGQVYVADTNNDRVLKLSAAGTILLELGRQNKKKDDDAKPGKGAGEFNKPAGVAVDVAGSIYVSDRENRRIQVFSSTGALTLQFPLPLLPSHDDDDDSKDKDEAGKPAGIAVDSAGTIYVADPKGSRVLKFSPAGVLLQSLAILDEEGKLGQPFGLVVSPAGDCLLVSDRKHSLIFKFDAQGHQTLVFGGKGKKKSGIIFNKPMGLALDTVGNLYVADRNNNKIREFGLPGQPTLVVPPARPEDDHVARGVVDTEEGGEVLRKDKAGVIVPATALAEDLKITVSQPKGGKDEEKSRHNALAEKELKIVSPPVSYAPHGTQFQEPVTLVLPYNANLAAAQKADESKLQVHYWNEKKGEWEALESQVNEKDKTVKAKTKHFSLYQVLAGSSTQTQALKPLAADASFAFRDLYVFPNPARAGAKPRIHLAVGIADKVTIRIYDVSGRELHQATLFEQPAVIDDGTGDKYAYEYAWDGRIASGVYLYVIEAEKQGFGTIRKSGKFGVVR